MLNIRTVTENRNAGAAGALLAALAAGYFLADSEMAGAASFADIALSGALELPMSASVLAGGLIRSMVSGSIGKNIVKLTAMIVILIMKLFTDQSSEPRMSGIITGASIFVSGAAVSAVIGEVLYKLLFYIFYGALAGFTAYSAAVIIQSLKRRRVMDVSSPYGCAYAVVYTMIVSSLCTVRTPVINLGIIFGAALTVTAACYYRHLGGVLCGALTTCGAFLASPEYGMTVVLLPAVGLLTGYLYKQKYTVIAAAFTGIYLMLTILTGITASSVESMLNIILGAAVFTAAAPNYSDKWVMTASDRTAALPEIMNLRMGFLSDSIAAVRKESGKIAEILDTSADKPSEIEENSRIVCTHCFRRLICWKNDYDMTIRGFRKLSALCEFSKETFPYELDECLHKQELMEAFENSAREKATAALLEMRFSESRRLLFEQIRIMEELVESAGERMDVRYSEPISKVMRTKLEKYGYKPHNVIAYYNSCNRLLAELYFSYSDAPQSCIRVCDLIADELRIPMASAEPVSSGKDIRIRLYEKPAYELEVYGASMCADGSNENGDTSLVFGDGTGVNYVILSDGMGCGRSAAVESRMVVRMFRKLVTSGVNCASAIKLINSIMLTKSRDETFATLDAVRINMDNCGLTVMKSGATATLIRHRGSVMKITSPTFPIGIYEQSETFSRSYDFEEGDIMIMFSDGISENEYRFIRELLLGGDDIKRIVDEICSKAGVFNPTVRSDDVTVIGIKVTRSAAAL